MDDIHVESKQNQGLFFDVYLNESYAKIIAMAGGGKSCKKLPLYSEASWHDCNFPQNSK